MQGSDRFSDEITRAAMECGAVAAGITEAVPVESGCMDAFESWIDAGMNAGMDYLERHALLRGCLDSVLPGTRTVISCAFSFKPHREVRGIAAYALGKDYHKVLRKRLKPLVRLLEARGGTARICVDTAPVAERYWAVRSGIASPCLNGTVSVPGHGSCVFLAEVLTDLEIAPASVIRESTGVKAGCNGCGACRRACPTGALGENGVIDARRCLSYLTIEHKGEFSQHQQSLLQEVDKGKLPLYGCDACLRACPLNTSAPCTEIGEFAPLPAILRYQELDQAGEPIPDRLLADLTTASAMSRAGADGLRRNLRLRKQ